MVMIQQDHQDDYDGLLIGMKVKLRGFGTSFAVSGLNKGDIVEIIGFTDDGRVIIQGAEHISQDLAKELGLPQGAMVISRGHIAEIMGSGPFPSLSHVWIGMMKNKRCQVCGAYSNLSSGYAECPGKTT